MLPGMVGLLLGQVPILSHVGVLAVSSSRPHLEHPQPDSVCSELTNAVTITRPALLKVDDDDREETLFPVRQMLESWVVCKEGPSLRRRDLKDVGINSPQNPQSWEHGSRNT